MPVAQYQERMYAGVLGKIIGVYLGRAVEGWSYEAIRSRFGTVDFYVNEHIGMPLIVPDDDISGTFVFYRALADNGYPAAITARQVGETWLNYVIEDKTILWWGGLSRSTEHTAFLRLKAGFPAPQSGSIALNGQSMAEQIGAEIFVDTWAMVNPGDPERAVAMAREAASVSHDGLAVEAACVLAAMEALAFDEPRLEVLIEQGLKMTADARLLRMAGDVIDVCATTDDWRAARDWIAQHHGYERYPGNCPMATNHLAVLMALMMGGDDFQRSIMIAASAGWDTDCNAGNVGCLNGIRQGLPALDAGADLRRPVGDRMLVVSADGGECFTDAVIETRKIAAAAAALRGETVQQPAARYAFEYAGSTQGFAIHPTPVLGQAVTRVENALGPTGEAGLLILYEGLAPGARGTVSAQTFVDPEPKSVKGTSYFEVIASPTLYPTQTVRATIKTFDEVNPALAFFVDYYDENDEIATLTGSPCALAGGINDVEWTVPDTGGHPIYRLGIELTAARRLDGAVALLSLDWSGAPERFVMGRSMELSPSLTPWTTVTTWMNSFVSSARNLAPDYTTTLSLSHPTENGAITTGTRDWGDYEVASTITFLQQRAAGLVARARGHRRYYAAVIRDGQAAILKRRDGEVITLAAGPQGYAVDERHALALRVEGDRLAMFVDGQQVAEATDGEYTSGGAGFVVDEGGILCDGFSVARI